MVISINSFYRAAIPIRGNGTSGLDQTNIRLVGFRLDGGMKRSRFSANISLYLGNEFKRYKIGLVATERQ